MARSKIHVGIEIGTTKVLAVVGEVKPDGNIRILGTGEAPSRGVRKGEIIDYKTIQTCLHDAIFHAENASDVQIRTVILSVTGGHIDSLNNRNCITLPEDQNEITEHEIEEVKRVTRDVTIPRDNVFLHGILQHYYLDGHERVVDPVGMVCNRLEASYHIVHGVKTRIINSVNCVKEMMLDVEAVVFAPLASAQIVLNRDSRERGALLIDIGGGTTDYALYRDGVVVYSGCIPVGGDHITNDLAVVFKLPTSKADMIKTREGSAMPGDTGVSEFVHVPDDASGAGHNLPRIEVDSVINARMVETFEILREKLRKNGGLDGIGAGVFLTGGTSRMLGIDRCAAEVFGLPVDRRLAAAPGEGRLAPTEDPAYSTGLGLIRYAQLKDREIRESSNPITSFFRRIVSSVR